MKQRSAGSGGVPKDASLNFGNETMFSAAHGIMKIKPLSIALTVSVFILATSVILSFRFAFKASMAFYLDGREAMKHFQHLTDISSIVSILAAIACIVSGILVFRARRHARK